MKQKLKIGIGFRSAALDPALINDEKRTIPITFSSEAPVERWIWTGDENGYVYAKEVLDHTPTSVRLERMKTAGAVLVNHDKSEHIGTTDDISIGSDRKGHAVVRFGRSAYAGEILQDVKDGIRKGVSFRYQVYKYVPEIHGEEIWYRAMDWEVFEICFESIPADITVGPNRSAPDSGVEMEIDMPGKEPATRTTDQPQETRTMKCQHCQKDLVNGLCPDKCAERAANTAAATARDAGVTAERQRVADINTIAVTCERNNPGLSLREDAVRFITEGRTTEDFQKFIVTEVFKARVIVNPPNAIGMSEAEINRYSFFRAIDAAANNNWSHAGLEREASEAAVKIFGRGQGNFRIPPEVLRAPFNWPQRGVGDHLSTTTPAAGPGSSLIATNVLFGSFIDMLRNAMLVRSMGARVLTDLVGDVAIPKQTGGATMYWFGKDGSVTNKSAAEFGQVALTPHPAGAYTEILRNTLKQSGADVEGLIRLDLMQAMAIGLDLASIAGGAPGATNEPTGILYTTGIGAVALGASGSVPTFAKLVALWKAVAKDNALFGSLGFLTNSSAYAEMMVTEKASDTAQFIASDMGPDGFGRILGYRCGISEQVPSDLTKLAATDLSAVIFGNFADLIIGLWGGLDILVNPYALDTQGGVRITVMQDMDVAVRHAESFAAIKDMVTTTVS